MRMNPLSLFGSNAVRSDLIGSFARWWLGGSAARRRLPARSVGALLGLLGDALRGKIDVHERRGRDRKNLIGRRVAHLDARRGRQEDFVAPRIAPKPIFSGESEGNAKRGAHENDRVCEIYLAVDRPIGVERLERRVGAHQREATLVDGLGQSHKFEMRRRSRSVRAADKRHRFCVAEENRSFGRVVGRDEFGRLEIGDHALKTDVERLEPLHATKAAMPIRHPLAGDGAERATIRLISATDTSASTSVKPAIRRFRRSIALASRFHFA